MNIELFDRPIAYHRCFVTITGSVTTAVLLSQAVYWNNRATLPDGWFWKTQDEWFDETGLSRWEQEGARKVLKKLGILNEKLEGIPAKLYYQINVKKLLELVQITPTNTPKTGCNPSKSQYEEKPHTSMRKTSKQDEVKTTYRNEEKPHTITENTTEITSENVVDDARAEKIPEFTISTQGVLGVSDAIETNIALKKWLEYFVNGKGYAQWEAQTVDTVPMFLEWEKMGVTDDDMVFVELQIAKSLKGDRPATIMYYKPIVKSIVKKRKSQDTAANGPGSHSNLNTHNHGDNYEKQRYNNATHSATGSKFTAYERETNGQQQYWKGKQQEAFDNARTI